ncbi:Uncharacterized protein APZ42_010104, partial [Daphnia magna]
FGNWIFEADFSSFNIQNFALRIASVVGVSCRFCLSSLTSFK